MAVSISRRPSASTIAFPVRLDPAKLTLQPWVRMLDDTNFSGRTVLVVGGSSGIGNGIAHGFRERGAASKQFATRYYNVDIHKAALALPEFVREALGEA